MSPRRRGVRPESDLFEAEMVARWRAEAARLRASYGAEGQATTLETCARELEEAHRAAGLEALTLQQASAESGLSYSALEKSVRAGRLPNAGQEGRPRVLRRDLPVKGRRTLTPGLADHLLARRGSV